MEILWNDNLMHDTSDNIVYQSVNWTWSGTGPVVCVTVKPATGGGGSAVMVAVPGLELPPGPLVVRDAV